MVARGTELSLEKHLLGRTLKYNKIKITYLSYIIIWCLFWDSAVSRDWPWCWFLYLSLQVLFFLNTENTVTLSLSNYPSCSSSVTQQLSMNLNQFVILVYFFCLFWIGEADENDENSNNIPNFSQLRIPSAKTLRALEDINTKLYIGTEVNLQIHQHSPTQREKNIFLV